jgi:hypothetical protein
MLNKEHWWNDNHKNWQQKIEVLGEGLAPAVHHKSQAEYGASTS